MSRITSTSICDPPRETGVGESEWSIGTRGVRLAMAGVALWCLAGSLGARTIQWYTLAGGEKRFSDDTPLDASMQFELGVFEAGFTPTPANRAEWATHWVAAQRVGFDPEGILVDFAGNFSVTSNAAPFTVGKQAYIWGFNDALEGGEWILASDSSWTWPEPDPLSLDTLFWNIATATDLQAGEVHASGSPFVFRTSSVPVSPPPITTWEQWRVAELSGEAEDGVADDPDRDGVSNFWEFVYGTPPLGPAPLPVLSPQIVEVNGSLYQQLSIPRRVDRLATLEVGVSTNLTGWESGPAFTVEVSSSPSDWVVRSLAPLGPGQQQEFLRVEGTVPAP